jgi:DNA-binding transcriptional ArsR family regulator
MEPRTKIRDLTEPRHPLAVEIDSSPVYDMLLSLWLMASDESFSDYELGNAWFQALEERLPAELRSEFDSLPEGLWLALVNLLPMVAGPCDLDEFAAWLEASDGVDLRTCFLDMTCSHDAESKDLDRTVIRAAAEGDADALERVLTSETLPADRGASLRRLMAIPGRTFAARIASLLRRYRDDVYADIEKEHRGPIARDAEAKGALLPTTSVDRMIEIATNGVNHAIPAHVNRLVLAPSVVLRPWSVLIGHRDTHVLCHPVADEFLDQNADAPPQMLVKAHRALGDERRLRILHRLSSSEESLHDLAAHFGVAKSTLHHHIGILRAAGLVRVTIDAESGHTLYSLRRVALEEAARLMKIYLETA